MYLVSAFLLSVFQPSQPKSLSLLSVSALHSFFSQFTTKNPKNRQGLQHLPLWLQLLQLRLLLHLRRLRLGGLRLHLLVVEAATVPIVPTVPLFFRQRRRLPLPTCCEIVRRLGLCRRPAWLPCSPRTRHNRKHTGRSKNTGQHIRFTCAARSHRVAVSTPSGVLDWALHTAMQAVLGDTFTAREVVLGDTSGDTPQRVTSQAVHEQRQ